MVSILFRLLMVQMTITMAMALEGRTAHYVSIVDPPSNDADAKLITCPVFSIRPEGETTKYTKYIAEASQADTIAWTPALPVTTFKGCAKYAAVNAIPAFLWDTDAESCQTTSTTITRQTEPCNDDTATLMYLAN